MASGLDSHYLFVQGRSGIGTSQPVQFMSLESLVVLAVLRVCGIVRWRLLDYVYMVLDRIVIACEIRQEDKIIIFLVYNTMKREKQSQDQGCDGFI